MLIELRRPGTESVLIPKFGIAQECNTSAEVVNSWIGVFSGTVV